MPRVFPERSDSPAVPRFIGSHAQYFFQRRLLQPESLRATAWAPQMPQLEWALLLFKRNLCTVKTCYYNRDVTAISCHRFFSKPLRAQFNADVYIASNGRSLRSFSDIYLGLSYPHGCDKLFFVWNKPTYYYGFLWHGATSPFAANGVSPGVLF